MFPSALLFGELFSSSCWSLLNPFPDGESLFVAGIGGPRTSEHISKSITLAMEAIRDSPQGISHEEGSL